MAIDWGQLGRHLKAKAIERWSGCECPTVQLSIVRDPVSGPRIRMDCFLPFWSG